MTTHTFYSWHSRSLLRILTILALAAGALSGLLEVPSFATTLAAQWRKLPGEKVKPESGSALAPKPVTGGHQWVDAAQDPAYAPVTFSGQFWAEGLVHATLAGVTVSGTNDDGICSDYAETTSATVYLKLYQTYDFTLYGDDVYMADGSLSAPSVLDLFSSRTVGQQPERLYKLYIWVPDAQKWEILCSANAPAWNVDVCTPGMTATFKIQVRPDLGARPVTRTGVTPSNGNEQGDDSWTRSEPAVDAQAAPGDGTAVKISSSKLGDPSSVRFQWDAFLGRLWNGSGAGRLRLDQSRLTTNAYTPAGLTYGPPAAETNELYVLMDLDYTNWFAQVYTPQALATIDQLYGSALFSTSDFLAVEALVIQLTNHTDPVSAYLWTNFTSTGRQTLTNTSSTQAQLASTLTSELNTILQGPSIYDSTRFAGVTLMGRTKRLLLLNPTGADLVRLNRFLIQDTYGSEINPVPSTRFAVNFYLPSQVGPVDSLGFFTLLSGASNFVSWQIGLPVGATNQWQVQEVRNGATNSTLLSWAPSTGTWTLTEGTGNDARIETRTIVSNVVAGVTNAIETQQVSNGASVVSDRTTEVYQQFAWGYEMVAVTNDPGGANSVTQFTFNTDTNDQATFGKIASISYPDGFWEQHIYSEDTSSTLAPYGALIRIIQPWENSSSNDLPHNGLVTDYNYNHGGPGTYSVQKWHGADTNYSTSLGADDYDPYLSRNYSVVYEEETFMYLDTCADSQGVVTEERQSGNLQHYGEDQSTSTYTPYYGRLAGQVYSKADEIGTFDSYDYEFGVWDPNARTFTDYPQVATDHDVRQTIFHGFGTSAPHVWPVYDVLTTGPSGNTIDTVYMIPNRSTEEIRVIQGGNLVARELYVYQGNLNNFALIDQLIYQRDSLGHATNVFRVDPGTGQSRVIYQADWTGSQTWPTDLKLGETDQAGSITNYTYDSLKRVKTVTLQPGSGQSALVTTFSYDAAGRVLTNLVSGGTLSQQTISLYDPSGRLIQQITPQLLSTSYAYQNGGQQTTVTEASGAITTVAKYLDRRLASIVGTAVTNQFFSYSQNWMQTFDIITPQNVTTITLGSSNALRWTASVTDTRYQPAGSQQPAFNDTNPIVVLPNFDADGLVDSVQTTAITDLPADGYDVYRGLPPLTFYQYDEYGQRIVQATADPATDPSILSLDLASNQRITTWTNYYQQDGQGAWFQVSEQWSYPYPTNATPALAQRTKTRLTGFASTRLSETQTFDVDTNETDVQISVNLAAKTLTSITTAAQSSLSATQVVVNGLLQSQSTTNIPSPALHYYDSLRRETGARDSLGNLTQTQYDPVTGQVVATINAQGLKTSMGYYAAGGHAAGLLKSQTGPTGRSAYYDYNDRGQVTYIWGDVPYPEKREYNQFGDQTTLSTYRAGIGWSGSTWPAGTAGAADVTSWYYDEPTGLLTNKTDAAGHPVTYDYYNTHQLRTRLWARGVGTTNFYRANGDFVRIDYSDGTSVKFTDDDFPYLNRLSKPDVVLDNAGTAGLVYDHAARLVSTVYSNGILAGITVTNHLNSLYGRDLLQVLSSNATPSTIYSAGYGYDAYGRMGTVSSGPYSAVYSYVPNSDQLQATTCKSNSATVLTTTRTWDYGYRLRSIANVANGATITSHSYLYDSLDRRIQATLEDGSVWKYNYNDRNELIGAHRYWSDWTPVSGQQYGYDYDSIGNRTDAKWGGDTSGANLRTTSYSANALNQYTSITTPGYQSIIGAALAGQSVTVNSATADRKGEYFHNEITVGNGSGPVWQSTSVTCDGNTTNGGFAYRGSSSALTYDLDGNLTFDGTWTYEWDPENRLSAMSMTNLAGIANSNRLRLEFVYDFLGRRVSKAVKSWNGSVFNNPSTTYFAYDSWNLVAALNPSLTPKMVFMWGSDLGGTMDKAGGVGGLLMSSFCGTSQTNCFISYDGNGNVTALLDIQGTATQARYEYNPFGKLARASGSLCFANPFRFSTKFWDQESGLLYYNYRLYSPDIGRWINRDPSAEVHGVNLYAFVFNAPNSRFDTDGRFVGSLIDFIASEAIDLTLTVLDANVWSTLGASMIATLADMGGFCTLLAEIGIQAGVKAGTYAAAYVGTAIMISRYGDSILEFGEAFVSWADPNPGGSTLAGKFASLFSQTWGPEDAYNAAKGAFDALDAYISGN